MPKTARTAYQLGMDKKSPAEDVARPFPVSPDAPASSDTELNWPGQMEFVSLIAALMAINAMSIDIVLPALGIIGDVYRHTSGNDIQLIITAYIVTFGLGQLALGPVIDRFGRRSLLLVALGFFAVACFLGIFAPTFKMLLAARAAQGLSASILRVLAVAIVRDRYHGRAMARTMSTVMMVFMVVPLFAPALGQILLFVGPWQLLFVAMGTLGTLAAIWASLRLPESLPKEHRRRIVLPVLLDGYRMILTNRTAFGYMVASGFVFGVLFSFITASNQIFLEVYNVGAWFPVLFGGIACGLAATNFINSRFVETIGMRALAHTALCVLVAGTSFHALLAALGFQPLWLFVMLTEIPFLMLGFLGANMTALALDPLGKVTGLATSLQGFITSGAAGFLGTMVGQAYNGTAVPFAIGTAILSICALVIVFWTEKGELMAFQLKPNTPHDSDATA